MASLQPSPAAPPAAAFPSRRGWLWWVAAAVGVYAALLAAHWPLLHLPYYWDEAGYFVPAALDLFRHGWWIPRTTLANGHPPLLMAALALAWRVGGVGIAVSRCTVLIFAAALVLGTARLAGMLAGRRAAWIAALWLAVMPLCFAQATLVQLDLPAAAWAVWALVAWASGRRWIYAALAAAGRSSCASVACAKHSGITASHSAAIQPARRPASIPASRAVPSTRAAAKISTVQRLTAIPTPPTRHA
ncbi:MAG: hypothetical protein ACRD13_01770, partial [Terriglobales bacterium]